VAKIKRLTNKDYDYAINDTHKEFKQGKITRQEAKKTIEGINKSYKTQSNNKAVDEYNRKAGY